MLKRWRIAPAEWLVLLLLIAVSVLVFGTMVARQIADSPYGDYSQHFLFAQKMIETGQLSTAHVLYEVLAIALKTISPLSIESAGWIVAIAAYIATALILYALIRAVLDDKSLRSSLLSACITIALMIVTPITLLTLGRHNLFYGYVGITLYHNPTITLLRPFALLLFVFTLGLLEHRAHFSTRTIIIGILLVALSAFAKPNEVLSLLPALLIVVAYRWYRRDRADLKTVVVSLILPMIALLVLEYAITYLFIGGDSHIIFAPLVYERSVEGSRLKLVLKFWLSIVFPLAVYPLYHRETRRNVGLNIAWLTFFMGAAQMYLLAESGYRFGSGNFLWSAQITLFILFVFSTLFWLRHFRQRPAWKGWLCLAAFALHIVSGLIFYVVQFRGIGIANWG